eukprot:gene17618-biopygen1721
MRVKRLQCRLQRASGYALRRCLLVRGDERARTAAGPAPVRAPDVVLPLVLPVEEGAEGGSGVESVRRWCGEAHLRHFCQCRHWDTLPRFRD